MELVGGMHKAQFNGTLSAPFGSPAPSGSSEDLLIWPSVNDFGSDELYVPQLPYLVADHLAPSGFNSHPLSVPIASSSVSFRTQAHYSGRPPRSGNTQSPHADDLNRVDLGTTSTAVSSSQTCSLSHSNIRRMLRSRAPSPPVHLDRVRNVEDYIELDMYSRSVVNSDEGETFSDQERYSPNREPTGVTGSSQWQPGLLGSPISCSPECQIHSPTTSGSCFIEARASDDHRVCSHLKPSSSGSTRPTTYQFDHAHSRGSYPCTLSICSVPTHSNANTVPCPNSASHSDIYVPSLQPQPRCFQPVDFQSDASSPTSSSNSSSSCIPHHATFRSSDNRVPDPDTSLPYTAGSLLRCASERLLPSDVTVSISTASSSCPTHDQIMLAHTNELATGGSLTCTVVNILRGLRLLDRCGLEDLCASLYGSQPDRPLMCEHLLNEPFSINSTASDRRCGSVITRSSSFTAPALISPRRSTIPRDDCCSDAVCALSPFVGMTSSVLVGSCIAAFILNCSHLGSAIGVPQNGYPFSLSSGLPPLASAQLTGTSWRHGSATKLVTLLTSNPPNSSKHSRTTVSRLVAGRFFPGPNCWRSAWPGTRSAMNYREGGALKVRGINDRLALWLSSWISCGAALVLAQLDDSVGNDEWSGLYRTRTDTDKSVCELVWRHRLIYGITQDNKVFLTNPVELVPIDHLVCELARQTSIRVEKSQLARIWSEHQLHHGDPSTADGVNSCCSGDFSILAHQPDQRWRELNILGQVLQTLRGLESCPSHRDPFSSLPPISSAGTPHLEQSCLSPSILIPSSQMPGISLFVARSDWELVHSLYTPTNILE
ncbi:hypothetical protein AHF37_03498 [Paragonimus kellicotti]|nr:hypothetical protein AHF37_03498 [Paragonimus kellicotti]